MLCIAAAGAITALAASSFSLSWTHSVERTVWQEHWTVAGDRLVIVEASVEGSGAGIAPPPDAVLREGRWHYRPSLAPLRVLRLAASGATPSPWTLCLEGGPCLQLGRIPDDTIAIWPASRCISPP